MLHPTGERVTRDNLGTIRRHGGVGFDEEQLVSASEGDAMFEKVYTAYGRRVRIVDADEEEHIRWGPCGTRSAQAALMVVMVILQLLVLLFLVVAAIVCWAYVYPNTVELVDAKLENGFQLAINLLTTNVPVVEDELSCIFGVVCNKLNEALGPFLGVNISCDVGSGNQTIGDICPFSFAGLTHNVSSSQISEALGSTCDTSAPPISSQLRDLKYDTSHTGSGSSRSSGSSSLSMAYLSPSAEDSADTETYISPSPPTA